MINTILAALLGVAVARRAWEMLGLEWVQGLLSCLGWHGSIFNDRHLCFNLLRFCSPCKMSNQVEMHD